MAAPAGGAPAAPRRCAPKGHNQMGSCRRALLQTYKPSNTACASSTTAQQEHEDDKPGAFGTSPRSKTGNKVQSVGSEVRRTKAGCLLARGRNTMQASCRSMGAAGGSVGSSTAMTNQATKQRHNCVAWHSTHKHYTSRLTGWHQGDARPPRAAYQHASQHMAGDAAVPGSSQRSRVNALSTRSNSSKGHDTTWPAQGGLPHLPFMTPQDSQTQTHPPTKQLCVWVRHHILLPLPTHMGWTHRHARAAAGSSSQAS